MNAPMAVLGRSPQLCSDATMTSKRALSALALLFVTAFTSSALVGCPGDKKDDPKKDDKTASDKSDKSDKSAKDKKKGDDDDDDKKTKDKKKKKTGDDDDDDKAKGGW